MIFLDADDWFELDMLEKSYEYAEATHSDIVLFDAWFYDDETHTDSTLPWALAKSLLPNKEVFSPTDCSNVLFELTGGQAWNKLYLRGFIEKFKIRFASVHFSDDQFFTFLSFACARKISAIYRRFIHYRHNAVENQSSKVHNYPEAGYVATDILYDELKRRNLYDYYKIALANRGIATGITILNFMTEDKCFEKLYNELKYKYFVRWGVFEVPREKLAPYRRSFLDKMLKYSAMGFLLNEYRERINPPPNDRMLRLLKAKMKNAHNIAIYGAGKQTI